MRFITALSYKGFYRMQIQMIKQDYLARVYSPQKSVVYMNILVPALV
jgi:hypothetical protein